MKLYRPTTLNLASRHCPRAIDFYEQRTPYDRSVYATGTAAHAVLQALGERSRSLGAELSEKDVREVADAACRALIEFGRKEEGEQEPPLAPDAVFAGRDLALNQYALAPLSPFAFYEIGLAVDADWQPVEFDAPTARLRCILDVLEIREDFGEESSSKVLEIVDYKSSWQAGEEELETTQRKAQACVAFAHFGEGVDRIEIRVPNLRTFRAAARSVVLEHGGREELAQWQRDVEELMDASDKQALRGRRPARPGKGCNGCPYLLACDDAQRYMEDTRIPGTPLQRAEMYCVAVATMDRVRDMLRDDTEEAPIEVHNGVVGTVGSPKRVLTETGYRRLAEEWELSGGELAGFAKALALTPSNAEALAKVLFPQKADKNDREALLAEVTAQTITRRFGIHPPQDARKETRDDEHSNAA